jgi:hypothetical protein
MPFSWVKIPSNTSRKIRECAGDDRSKARLKECVVEIVESDGGTAEAIYFEVSGRFAHAHIHWDTQEQKRNILFDLEAAETVDLYEAEEIDDLIAQRYSAD